MPQDVADNLRGNARVDLSRGVAMAEHMGAKRRNGNPGAVGVLAHLVTESAGGEGAVRQPRRHEHFARRAVAGAVSAQVGRRGLGDRTQQRQFDGHRRFRPPSVQDAAMPIDVVEAKANHLSRSETIGRQQQDHRVVAPTNAIITRDRVKNPSNTFPRQISRRALIDSIARRYYTGGEVALDTPGRSKEPQKGSKRTAQTCYGPPSEPSRRAIDKVIKVACPHRSDSSALRPQRSEEVTGDLLV
jgi:hypothetical protein